MSDFTTQGDSIQTIIHSPPVGALSDTSGSAFNDAHDVGSWLVNLNIDTTHPFVKIQVQFRENSSYIDGLTVIYQLLDDGSGQIGPSSPIQHGSQYTGGADDSDKVVTFNSNEILLAVTGRAGSDGSITAIRELTILKFNTQSGAITTNTFGKNDNTAPFYASGPIVAFAGTEDKSLKELGLKTLSCLSFTPKSTILAEEVIWYDHYADASIASCKFVNKGKKKIVPSQLKLYKSTLKASPAFGKVVGVGVQTPAGIITPVVRLDMDNTGKGIHFNAVNYSDSSQKLAACLKKTNTMTPEARTHLYMEYIKGLENRSALFIWEWWESGIANREA